MSSCFRSRQHWSSYAAAWLALLTVPISAFAMQPHADFADIAHTADAVFVGTVTGTNCRLGPMQNTILTDVTFDNVMEVGKKPGVSRGIESGMVLTFEGGQIGDIGLTVSDVPTFEVGKKYVLFAQMIEKNDSNPLIGGRQGLFEVIADATTGTEYALTSSGAGIINVSEGKLATVSRVSGVENGAIIRRPKAENMMPAPVSADGRENTAVSRVESVPGTILTLKQFVQATQEILAAAPPEKSMLRRAPNPAAEGNVMPLTGRIPTSSLLQKYLAGEPLPIRSNAESAFPATEGDTLFYCGSQELPIIMEQVSPLLWTYDQHTHACMQYNKTMNVYQYRDDDGSFGSNYYSEFCGFLTDSMKDNAYGTGGFGSAIAVCRSWYTPSRCSWLYETDIMFNGNPGYEWTNSFSQSLGTSKYLYMPVLMHELGHSWGMQRGTENYNYDQPSVMHAYYHDLVENGENIHHPEARAIRLNYDDQAGIPDYKDMGVESYYAQDGLHNSTTDRFNNTDNGTYQNGEQITIQNLTVENMARVDSPGLALRLYLSVDRAVDAFSDYPLGTWNFPGSLRESMWVGNVTGIIPGNVPTGSYYIVASVTVDGTWETSYDANNHTSLYHTVNIVSPTPSVPTGVAATDGTETSAVIVTWNVVAGATHYEVWRNTSNNSGTATRLTTVGAVTQYYDIAATPGVTYYYWLKSVSGGGTVSGFSTSNNGWRKLSFPNNVQASEGTSTAHTHITWDAVAGASHYRVYVNSVNSTGTASALTGWITAREAFHTVGNPAQTYYYWVLAAVDSTGTRATVLNEFASDSGYKALSPVTGVQATDGTYSDRIEVSWNASPVTASYRVYRGTSSDPVAATALSSWQSGTSFSDTTAQLDTTYYYFVLALANSRQSDYSDSDTGFLAWPPVAAPTGVAASDGTYTGYVRITWNTVSGATHYRVYRSQSTLPVLSGPITDWISATSFNDTTVSPGLTMNYWVKAAINAQGGRSSDSGNYNSGWRKLSPPAGLQATDGTYPDKIVVSWDSAAGASYYRIHRAETTNVLDATPLSDWISETSYEDTPANVCTSYFYWLQSATSSTGTRNSDLSSLPTAGYRALETPTAPVASNGTSLSHIEVTWSPVAGASYYRLYRNTVDDPATAITPMGSWQTTTSVQDIYADPGKDYFYWIKAAANSSGGCASNFSPSDSGWRALPAPTNVVASDGTYDNRVRITWSESSSWAACRVLRGRTSNLLTALPISDWIWPRSFDDTSADAGTTYYYWVVSAAGDGSHPTSATGPDTGYRVSPAPANVIASNGTYLGFVHVKWDAVPGATHYRVYRYNYNIPAGSTPVTGWITDLAIEDTTALQNVYYFYWVKAAADGAGLGESAWGTEDLGWRGTAPPVPASVISRRTHGTAGPFDIDVTAESSVESRSGGPTLLVVHFDKQIQAADGLTTADILVSSGTVTTVTMRPDLQTLDIELSGVQDDQMFSMKFPGISDTFNPVAVVNDTVCFKVLSGDANPDAAINIFDLIAIRNKLNQPVDNTNFRMDITADGNINIFDLIHTRNNLNHTVTGECPSAHEG